MVKNVYKNDDPINGDGLWLVEMMNILVSKNCDNEQNDLK